MDKTLQLIIVWFGIKTTYNVGKTNINGCVWRIQMEIYIRSYFFHKNKVNNSSYCLKYLELDDYLTIYLFLTKIRRKL